MTRQTVLRILWTIAVWTRGLSGTIFIVALNLLLFGANFELEDIWYHLRPLVFTSLFFHLIYILVYVIFSKIS